MRAILERGLLGLMLASLPLGAAFADDPAGPTAGDRVAASGTTRALKRFSERVGSGVGGALDAAGSATGRAGTAVSGAFGAADSQVTGWLGQLGFKPADENERHSRPGQKERRD